MRRKRKGKSAPYVQEPEGISMTLLLYKKTLEEKIQKKTDLLEKISIGIQKISTFISQNESVTQPQSPYDTSSVIKNNREYLLKNFIYKGMISRYQSFKKELDEIENTYFLFFR